MVRWIKNEIKRIDNIITEDIRARVSTATVSETSVY